MCADLLNIGRDLAELEASGVEYLHLDVMDGSFVPNFTLGFDIINALHAKSSVPLDVHLMINNPEFHIANIRANPQDIITVHYESTPQLQRAMDLIRAKDCLVGLALNPATPLCMVDELLGEIDMLLVMTVSPGFSGQKLVEHTLGKITAAREMISRKNLPVMIEVDGNVSIENAKKMKVAGADIFVAGTSSVFVPGKTIGQGMQSLRVPIAD